MKGLSDLTLLLLTVIIAALVTLVIFGVVGIVKDKPDEAEKVNCETACVAERVSGEPNIYGCNCKEVNISSGS